MYLSMCYNVFNVLELFLFYFHTKNGKYLIINIEKQSIGLRSLGTKMFFCFLQLINLLLRYTLETKPNVLETKPSLIRVFWDVVLASL